MQQANTANMSPIGGLKTPSSARNHLERASRELAAAKAREQIEELEKESIPEVIKPEQS